MRRFFEQGIFWIMLILYLILMIYSWYDSYYGTWNLNRTIGWGWDLTNFIWWNLPSISWSIKIFTIGYGILFFMKKKTNFILSILQILLVLINITIPMYNIGVSIIFIILNWIIFIWNMINSMRNKN